MGPTAGVWLVRLFLLPGLKPFCKAYRAYLGSYLKTFLMMKKTLLLLWSTCCLIGAIGQSNLVQLSDMLKIKQPGSIDVAADGSKAVFTVTSSVPDEKSKWEYPYQTQLWMLVLDGKSQPRQLTTQAAGASQPTLSPDGSTVLFVRAVDGKPQLFSLLLSQGGEPTQLTRLATGASGPQWSADGKRILFSTSVSLAELQKDSTLNGGRPAPAWSLQKPGFAANEHLTAAAASPDPDGSLAQVRAWLAQNEKDSKAKVINKLNFQQEAQVSGAISFTHWYYIDARADAPPVPVTSGYYSFANAQWVGNSYQVVAEAAHNLQQHPDLAQLETAVYLLEAGQPGMRKLLGTADSAFGGVSVSPTGRWMLLGHGKTSFVSQRQLALLPVGGSRSQLQAINFDRSVGSIDWSADEKTVYFTASSNGGTVLYKLDMASKKISPLTTVNEGVGSFEEEAGKILFVKTAVANPFELFLADANAANQQRVSAFNHEWVSAKTLSYPEKRSFKNEKGMEVEYWIMKPANWQAGKKYPTILEIHGGPSAMWGPGESSMWHEFQYYCAKGYTVVYANPRGSGGYGEAFLRGNINDWGQGPMSDVLTALDKSAAEFDWIDKNQLAVTGGSYAGYLIAYILGHDQRFKVACTQRGVYDLRTFFGEGNAWRLVPNYFGGYPWEPDTYKILERESPITYVDQVKTPLIIFHGENDLRTGVIQSEQFYRSLKVLGRTVEYVRHPGATHEITRSGNNRQRMDQMLRTWEFFERFIQH